jgi:hypothetical protein
LLAGLPDDEDEVGDAGEDDDDDEDLEDSEDGALSEDVSDDGFASFLGSGAGFSCLGAEDEAASSAGISREEMSSPSSAKTAILDPTLTPFAPSCCYNSGQMSSDRSGCCCFIRGSSLGCHHLAPRHP